jgi:transcriptional regulator with XRE-family HTH domain
MDIKSEIRDFLTSRRGRITPEEAGLKSFGQRRVPGLRREEVATLAGLSVEYYNRLERGNLGGASDTVLDALADALGVAARRPRAAGWLARARSKRLAFAENGRLDALNGSTKPNARYHVCVPPFSGFSTR